MKPLVEAVTHQSISGQSRRHIFARQALSSSGGILLPRNAKAAKPVLRKAGLSGAKILAIRNLAQKTIDGVVPTLDQAKALRRRARQTPRLRRGIAA